MGIKMLGAGTYLPENYEELALFPRRLLFLVRFFEFGVGVAK